MIRLFILGIFMLLMSGCVVGLSVAPITLFHPINRSVGVFYTTVPEWPYYRPYHRTYYRTYNRTYYRPNKMYRRPSKIYNRPSRMYRRPNKKFRR